jgi:hypothetical protein
MSPPPDLVLYYADLGRPYLPLIERTIASARRVMPQSRLVLLTPTPTRDLTVLFDLVMEIQAVTTPQTVCFDKVLGLCTWQAQMDRACAFIDPDLEFRKPIKFPDADVGLLWRKRSAQPVNAGMILARPGCPVFWRKYGVTAATLPEVLRGWWCDQLALSVMIGALREPGETVQAHDAAVKLIPEEAACAPPEKATEDTWALHYKGQRKGPGWENLFLGGKSGAGKSSPACA